MVRASKTVDGKRPDKMVRISIDGETHRHLGHFAIEMNVNLAEAASLIVTEYFAAGRPAAEGEIKATALAKKAKKNLPSPSRPEKKQSARAAGSQVKNASAES